MKVKRNSQTVILYKRESLVPKALLLKFSGIFPNLEGKRDNLHLLNALLYEIRKQSVGVK